MQTFWDTCVWRKNIQKNKRSSTTARNLSASSYILTWQELVKVGQILEFERDSPLVLSNSKLSMLRFVRNDNLNIKHIVFSPQRKLSAQLRIGGNITYLSGAFTVPTCAMPAP